MLPPVPDAPEPARTQLSVARDEALHAQRQLAQTQALAARQKKASTNARRRYLRLLEEYNGQLTLPLGLGDPRAVPEFVAAEDEDRRQTPYRPERFKGQARRARRLPATMLDPVSINFDDE